MTIVAKIDRVQLVVDRPKWRKLPTIKGFKTVSDLRPRQQTTIRTYDRVRRLVSKTGTQIFIQYRRQKSFLPAEKITIIPPDETGVDWHEIVPLLRLLKTYRLITVEFALDFDAASGVDLAFVRRYGQFGRSVQVQKHRPGELHYGSRRSAKFVRCYPKDRIASFRVELELHSILLRHHHIDHIEDLPALRSVVIPSHFRFSAFSWRKLRRYLRHKFGAAKAKAILRSTRSRSKSIIHAKRHLRHLGVANVQRFVTQFSLRNRLVAQAIDTWADSFEDACDNDRL